MKLIEIIQILLFFGLGIALTPPVGRFRYKVCSGWKNVLATPQIVDRFDKILTPLRPVFIKSSQITELPSMV
jgi:hypothetical protein